MIEKDGVLVHLDPKGDRIGYSDFVFDGWVAARRPVTALWLPAAGPARLTTCDRPDVRRVFPDRSTLGFSGECAEREIGPAGLRIVVQLGEQALEVEHPVPPALPQPPWAQRIASVLQLGWLRWREQMAANSSQRFAHMLRRHLLARRARGGVFQRRHSDTLLADFATAVPDALFLQIGANDGFTGDPLNHLIMRSDARWRGVLVEPVAHLFGQLSERYGDNRALHLERAAIGETDGTTVIHRLQTGPGDSLWLEQIPSSGSQITATKRRAIWPSRTRDGGGRSPLPLSRDPASAAFDRPPRSAGNRHGRMGLADPAAIRSGPAATETVALRTPTLAA